MRLSLVPQLVWLCTGLALQDLSLVALSSPMFSTQSPLSHQTVLTARRPTNVLFHPSNGKCVLRTTLTAPLILGPCDQSDAWNYTPQKFLTVKGTYYCLQAVGSDKPARLSIICSESDSEWNLDSSSSLNVRTHLSTESEDWGSLCLAVGSENMLFTSPCLDSDAQSFEFTTKDKVQTAG